MAAAGVSKAQGFRSGDIELVAGVRDRRLLALALLIILGWPVALPTPALGAPVTVATRVSDPFVVTDATGVTTAVWAFAPGLKTPRAIRSSTRPPGGLWGPAADIVSTARADGGGFGLSALDVDGRGTTYALWDVKGRGSTVEGVQLSARQRGGAWSAPETIAASSSAAGNIGPFASALAVAVDGTATVIWCRQTPDRQISAMQTATRAPAGSWSTPVTLAIRTARGCEQTRSDPQLEVDRAGNMVAVWFDNPPVVNSSQPPPRTVVAAYRSAGGAWSLPVAIATSNGIQPALAFDPAGRVQISGSSAGSSPWLVTLSPDGTATRAPAIPGGQRGRGTVQWVALGVDRAGTTVVVWGIGNDPLETTTLTASRRATGAWTRAIVFDSLAPNTGAPPPELATDALGNIVATWSSRRAYPAAGTSVFQAYRPSGGTWGARTFVADGDHGGWTVGQPFFTGLTIVAWTTGTRNLKLIAVDAIPVGRPVIRPIMRYKRTTAVRAIKRGGITLTCRLPAAGYCAAELVPSRQTARLIGGARRGCVHRWATEKARALRPTTITLQVLKNYPPCAGVLRRLRQAGPNLSFRATVTADAPGRTSSAITKRLLLVR